MITADTIDDKQIRELLVECLYRRIAEILNARAKESK